MIAYLEGEVIACAAGHAVVKTGGVGYRVLMCKYDLASVTVGQKIELFIHTNVREDAFELYGFNTNAHKELFLLLLSVSGVGPKLASNIASYFPQHELVSAILGKDIAKLASIPGIGKKTAERIALELKDKVLKLPIELAQTSTTSTTTLVSLQQAIKNLGFSKEQYNQAILRIEQSEIDQLPLEDLIKKTLTILSGAKIA